MLPEIVLSVLLQLLQSMLQKCLEMAGQRGLASVAFPAVGCGRLGYRPEVVASCFSRAVQNSDTALSVIAVLCVINSFITNIID